MNIQDLKKSKQWINWKYNNEKSKIPYCYKGYQTGTDTSHQEDWSDYYMANEAIKRYSYNGVGLILKNGICGIDIDHKKIDDPIVQNIINLMDTYTEYSPSREGIHLLFTVDIDKIPTYIEDGKRKLDKKYYIKNSSLNMECYISKLTNRYFTFTGNVINNKPINERTKELLVFLNKYMIKNTQMKTNSIIQEIIRKIENSKQSEKFKKLFYDGNIVEYDNDDSRADLALCGILAFYTKDFYVIDEIFKRSKLYREKWNRLDYKKDTINKAMDNQLQIKVNTEDNSRTVQKLETITAKDLQVKNLKPIIYYVDKILPQGLTIICSAPKIGKSWLALDLCLAITRGTKFLGFDTKKSDCLYLALEDSQNRLKDRMEKLLQGKEAPNNLIYSICCNDLKNGLIKQLEEVLKRTPSLKVIIIDTLQKVRSITKNNNVYAQDYKELSEIKQFADTHEMSIVVIHHTRKGKDTTDVFENISGTNGITGTADTTWIINKEKRSDQEATLSMTGRDIDYNEFIISFDKENCKWIMISTIEEFTEKRKKEEYNNNTLIKVIHTLINENNNSWTGSIKSINCKHEEMYGEKFEESPQKISIELRNLSQMLYNIDSIIYTPPKNPINGERLHKFKKI